MSSAEKVPMGETDGGAGPLAMLARAPRHGTAFLAPHHLEAAQHFRLVFERAHLRPRTTMSYDPVPAGQGKGGRAAADISDLASDSRKRLARLHRVLPPDCAGILIDVCGHEKGLQSVETERGWPRRSAKLVLRVALDALAAELGLMPHARGADSAALGGWRAPGARPNEPG